MFRNIRQANHTILTISTSRCGIHKLYLMVVVAPYIWHLTFTFTKRIRTGKCSTLNNNIEIA